MNKRILSLLAAFAFILSIGGGALAAEPSQQQTAAETLYRLGLLRGTGLNEDGTPKFELNRGLTRQEAVTMLVRLLGKESAALSENNWIPFYDVDAWARPYVGYAYAKGYTNGTGPATFGGSERVSATQYITFVLRALGYTSGTDFQWDRAWGLSDLIGLTKGEYREGVEFLRGGAVEISLRALSQTTKPDSTTLLYRLFSEGAVSSAAVNFCGLGALLEEKPLNIIDSYFKFRNAVFSIESHDSQGGFAASGSGFFIDSSGTAVTSFRSVQDAASASVTLRDGRVRKVLGIYDVSPENDLALIKVEGGPYEFLRVSSSAPTVLSSVFAFYFPRLGSCAITNGILLSANQEIDGVYYLKSSVEIPSGGGSGGPLLDAGGRVIGICSDKNGDGLAVPSAALGSLSQKILKGFSDTPSYTGFSFAPDFGAFNSSSYDPSLSGIKNGLATYYYEKSSIPTSDPGPVERYRALLLGRGFTYKGFFSGEDGSGGYLYMKGTHFVYIGTAAVNDTEYYVVSVL